MVAKPRNIVFHAASVEVMPEDLHVEKTPFSPFIQDLSDIERARDR